jgi:hypothetical protein
MNKRSTSQVGFPGRRKMNKGSKIKGALNHIVHCAIDNLGETRETNSAKRTPNPFKNASARPKSGIALASDIDLDPIPHPFHLKECRCPNNTPTFSA